MFFLDRNTDAGLKIQSSYAANALQPVFVACDLLDIAALRLAINGIAKDTGGLINFVVNCAGDDNRHDWQDLESEEWDRCLNLNLRHVLFTSQAAFCHMPHGGAIVNLGSKNAVNKNAGLIGYVSAKAGIMGMTGSLARECGLQGVRVNCVMPGLVRTARNYDKWMTPDTEARVLEKQCLKRVIEPSEVADLVLFLCSDQSAMITGQTIAIDGGS